MNRRSTLALVLCGLAGAKVAAAQSDGIAPALAVRIDSVFSRFAAPGSPGCALGVVRDGRMAYARGYGLASIELGVPITPATIFDIGSVSKQFTAMSVVLLAQDGKLALDDEIQKLIPEMPRYARPVTIRQLLHHTSGVRDYIDVLGWSGIGEEAVTTDDDALRAIVLQRAPNFEPGSEFLYSNSGFFLLSVIVKRASGKSLRDFAAERIFRPLGMSHTQFVDRHDMIVPGKAGSYGEAPGGGFTLVLANWEQTGDGAVNTSVEDLLKWDGNFASGAVGGSAAMSELQTPGLLTNGKPITYALGLVVSTYRGVRNVAHGGSWAGFRANLSRFPDQRLSILTLCNLATSGPGVLSNRVADLLLGAELAAVAPVERSRPSERESWKPTRAELAGFAGTYHGDELLADWAVTVRGDSLIAKPGLGADVVLIPTGRDTFNAYGTRVAFGRTGTQVTSLTLTNRGFRNVPLTRVNPVH